MDICDWVDSAGSAERMTDLASNDARASSGSESNVGPVVGGEKEFLRNAREQCTARSDQDLSILHQQPD